MFNRDFCTNANKDACIKVSVFSHGNSFSSYAQTVATVVNTAGETSKLTLTTTSDTKSYNLLSTELPVGDGNVSDRPSAGHVFVCNRNFRTDGARHTGEWFHGDTWNPLEKPHVKCAYDTNPNAISAQQLACNIPLEPVTAEEPDCLSMGMIGFTTNGVAIYNALDDAGHDAAAHEVQDLCNGHPQGKGHYH